jgi:4-hydroxy-tetrahydrodipicolinate synthase
VAPVPTPVDEQGTFDEAALVAHLAWLGEEGLDGALILGTNGEFPSFSLTERRDIARAAAKQSAGLFLLLNVGSCALPEVLQMLAVAGEGGYAAALCPPPFYFGSPPLEGLCEFFCAVLDASPVPVLLYHVPQVTGVPISDELLERLGAHPKLAGVKDSTGMPDELARLCPRFGDGYFVGNDHLVSRCLAAGGGGSISGAASVAPRLVRSIDAAGERQPALDALRSLLEEFGLGPSVKTLLRQRGFGRYGSRPPLADLPAPRATELLQRYESWAQQTGYG